MKSIQTIWNHPLYQEYYRKLQEAEKERIFCRHDMAHFLDVARIAWIRNLEQELGFRREVVYAAALLHDIGKYRQYAEGIPHEQASADLAKQILRAVQDDFTQAETEMILLAIRGHRKLREDAGVLESLLYDSDKKSRSCFACATERECDWSREKKNREIDI